MKRNSQWLRLRASMAGCVGLVPGGGTMIPHVEWWGKGKKRGETKTQVI